jgi:multiple sugar transport system ATP-binding protein
VSLDVPGAALPHGAARARVRRSERLSDLHLVHLELEGGPHGIVSAAPPDQLYASGQAVTVQATKWLCFGAEGQRIAA